MADGGWPDAPRKKMAGASSGVLLCVGPRCGNTLAFVIRDGAGEGAFQCSLRRSGGGGLGDEHYWDGGTDANAAEFEYST